MPQQDTKIPKIQSTINSKAQHITVPPGDEAKPMSCPICKEALKVEFLEDEEEWVWRNVVQKDDRVSLATLYLNTILILLIDLPCNVPC